MSDLISRQAAIDELDKEYRCTDQSDDWDGLKTAMLIIENLPSAQPDIVRCKDCAKHEYCRTSTVWAIPPKDDWYCADAERRPDEQIDIR